MYPNSILGIEFGIHMSPIRYLVSNWDTTVSQLDTKYRIARNMYTNSILGNELSIELADTCQTIRYSVMNLLSGRPILYLVSNCLTCVSQFDTHMYPNSIPSTKLGSYVSQFDTQYRIWIHMSPNSAHYCPNIHILFNKLMFFYFRFTVRI